MYLKQLIEFLENYNDGRVCRKGLVHPHSYRGYYEDLAFEVGRDVPVHEMLREAKECLGKTFEGYKGGEFTMHEYTEVWLADWGCTGEGIGPLLLEYMLNDEVEAPEPERN